LGEGDRNFRGIYRVIRLVSIAKYGCFGVIQDIDSASFSLYVLVTKKCEKTSLWNFCVFCVVWRE
jgi:hypothetical protein